MAGTLAPVPRQQFIDANGNPYAGGSLSTFLAGLATPVATHSDVGLAVPNAVVMTLNASGRPTTSGTEVAIYLTAGVSYKFVLKDSLGSIIFTQDDIAAIDAGSFTTLSVSGVSTFGTGVALSNTPGAGSVVLANTGVTDWNLRQNTSNALCFDYNSGASWTQRLSIEGPNGVLMMAGFGNHSIIGGGSGGNALRIQNQTAGTTNFGGLDVGNDADALALSLVASSSTYTTSTYVLQDSGSIAAKRSGGLSIAATHASGEIRFYSGGTTERMRIDTAGDVSVATGAKLVLDGLGSSLAYLTSAADTQLNIHAAGGQVAGFTANALGTITAIQVVQNLRYTGVSTPTTLLADANNYNPTGLTTSSILRLSSDASRTITGIVATTAWEVKLLINVGAQNIVLANASGSSTAANTFLCPGAGDFTLNTLDSAWILYDGTSSRWRVLEA